jgi:hypothetical protein
MDIFLRTKVSLTQRSTNHASFVSFRKELGSLSKSAYDVFKKKNIEQVIVMQLSSNFQSLFNVII